MKCDLCHFAALPVFDFLVCAMDGEETERVLCATCANNLARSVDIFEVSLINHEAERLERV